MPARTRIHTCAAFTTTTDPDEPIGATRHALLNRDSFDRVVAGVRTRHPGAR